eukprot:XP_011609595.1 PREDICTED: vacuolar protein sorting-associated protein 37B-like isoform X1 [Takifugu rubripes]
MKRPVVRAALLIDASCALSASLYIPMRTRCERVPTASTATRTDKMSKATEFGSCPDAYRSLNTEELSELLQNDDKMDQIIALDEKFQELQVGREMLLMSNRSLAEDSLTRRPRLCNGKFQLAKKYRELSNLAAACWEKQSQLEALVQNHSLQTAQNLLQEEVAHAEEHSEELLERFMEASLGLDDFLDSFQSSRKTYHIRRAKAEKVQEVSRGRQQPEKSKRAKNSEAKKTLDQPQGSQLPNGFIAQGPLRVFQVRYGLRPAILLPHCNISPTTSVPGHQASTPPPEPQVGPSLSPTSPLPGHGQPIGLRVIGQLPGGWPATGRPVRLQQLYRLSPQQTEPPFR